MHYDIHVPMSESMFGESPYTGGDEFIPPLSVAVPVEQEPKSKLSELQKTVRDVAQNGDWSQKAAVGIYVAVLVVLVVSAVLLLIPNVSTDAEWAKEMAVFLSQVVAVSALCLVAWDYGYNNPRAKLPAVVSTVALVGSFVAGGVFASNA